MFYTIYDIVSDNFGTFRTLVRPRNRILANNNCSLIDPHVVCHTGGKTYVSIFIGGGFFLNIVVRKIAEKKLLY